jgi:hypothetical protein
MHSAENVPVCTIMPPLLAVASRPQISALDAGAARPMVKVAIRAMLRRLFTYGLQCTESVECGFMGSKPAF